MTAPSVGSVPRFGVVSPQGAPSRLRAARRTASVLVAVAAASFAHGRCTTVTCGPLLAVHRRYATATVGEDPCSSSRFSPASQGQLHLSGGPAGRAADGHGARRAGLTAGARPLAGRPATPRLMGTPARQAGSTAGASQLVGQLCPVTCPLTAVLRQAIWRRPVGQPHQDHARPSARSAGSQAVGTLG